jgi:hypothetical protein
MQGLDAAEVDMDRMPTLCTEEDPEKDLHSYQWTPPASEMAFATLEAADGSSNGILTHLQEVWQKMHCQFRSSEVPSLPAAEYRNTLCASTNTCVWPCQPACPASSSKVSAGLSSIIRSQELVESPT